MHQRRDPQRGRIRRWLSVDPLGPALVAAAVVVFLLRGFGGRLTRDLALYAYAGQQFAEGVPPYEGVVNRAGPLAHMVPGFGALAARGLGTDDLMTMRVLMLVLSAVVVWLMYLLGRDLFRGRLAGVTCAATLITFQGFVIYATGGPREKTTMVLLVVCALLAVVHRRWAWAGVAVALATLTWQPAFWAASVAVVVAALVGTTGRSRLAALVRFALGGIAATAVVTAYFWWVGALPAFIDGFLLLNATSTRQSGLVEFLETTPGQMIEGFGWSLWVVLAGLLGMVVLGALAWPRPERRTRQGAAVVAFGMATLGSFAWSLWVFNGWADALFVLPFAALGAGGVVHLLVRRVAHRRAVALVAAYAVLAVAASGLTAWTQRPDDLAPMRAETEAVLAAAGTDVSVLSVGAPQPLVFGRLRNPLQHQMFIGGLQEYLDESWPGGLEAMAAVVHRDRPRYITMDHPSWYTWLHPVLEADYTEIGTTQGFTWYVDTSVGADEIARLEGILDSGP